MAVSSDDPLPKAGAGEATRVFARIGLLSFGGPAAQISVMHRILVDEKKWLAYHIDQLSDADREVAIKNIGRGTI